MPNLWWKCPSCGARVDFYKQLTEIFDSDDGKGLFDPEYGVIFHTIFCACGAEWTISISPMETSLPF